MTKSQESDQSESTIQTVIIDTNVIQYLSNKNFSHEVIADLQSLLQANCDLAISDFTFFETIDESNIETEQQRLAAIGSAESIPVTKEILIASGHIGCIYKQDNIKINDIGDKIIAATSVLTNSLIYTFNARDFPIPYFNILGKRTIEYTDKKYSKYIISYVLQPDIELISKSHQVRVNPFGEKQRK